MRADLEKLWAEAAANAEDGGLHELRPYQAEAVEAIAHIGGRVSLPTVALKGRAILGDEMGLGKTGIAYEAWKELSKLHPGRSPDSPVIGPALLVAGQNALFTWWRLAPHWQVPRPVRIEGAPAVREAQWKIYGGSPDKFVCCTRETLVRDIAKGWVPKFWQIIFTDEAHKHNNRKTKIWEALKQLVSPWMLICTGSPLKRGNQNLWAFLNLLNRNEWSSYWKYIQEYNHTIKPRFGGIEIIAPKNTPEWQKRVRRYMIRRTKSEVLPQLPPKTRERSIVEMSEFQQRAYNQLVRDSLAELSSAEHLIVAPTVLAKIMRMRQLLVSPKILDPNAEDGNGIERIVELLEEADDTHMCIYTAFTKVIPHLIDRLVLEGYDSYGIVPFVGGMNNEQLANSTKRFKETRGIALVSIQFAESFDLIPATWGVFLGEEWDPETNRQAEDRQHRMNTLSPVHMYYIHYPGTINEETWAILDKKTNMVGRSLMNYNYVKNLLQGTRP